MNTNSDENMPLVSVLVVTYNQENYISDTLDSIINQVCNFKYEILLGEDCSTDNTRDICIEYSKKYPEKIRLFLNEKNRGFITNYFSLLPEIKGKYVADCGGDDYWTDRNKLSRQIEILEKNENVGMVCSDWAELISRTNTVLNNKSGIVKDYYKSEEFGKEFIIKYINGQYPRVVLASACFRTKWLMDSVKSHPQLFNHDLAVCEDLPITLCMLSKGPVYYMKDELIVYRVLEKSVSHNKRDSYIRGFAWNAFKQTCIIINEFEISYSETAVYFKNKIDDFLYHSFIKKDSDFLSDILAFAKEYKIRLSFKMQLIAFIAKNRFLYGFCLGMWNIFKSK